MNMTNKMNYVYAIDYISPMRAHYPEEVSASGMDQSAGSPAGMKCGYCERLFKTARGLGQHKARVEWRASRAAFGSEKSLV